MLIDCGFQWIRSFLCAASFCCQAVLTWPAVFPDFPAVFRLWVIGFRHFFFTHGIRFDRRSLALKLAREDASLD
jgi:hypothetical protein